MPLLSALTVHCCAMLALRRSSYGGVDTVFWDSWGVQVGVRM
jgi:hypothetical protein